MILLLSFYFVATVVRLFLVLRESVAAPPELIEKIDDLFQKRDFRELYQVLKSDGSFLACILASGMSKLSNGLQEARNTLDRASDAATITMEKSCSMLAVLGTLGPMIGLLGTLQGMISSFRVIAETETQVKASAVAGGISTGPDSHLRGRAPFRAGHLFLRIVPKPSSDDFGEYDLAGRQSARTHGRCFSQEGDGAAECAGVNGRRTRKTISWWTAGRTDFQIRPVFRGRIWQIRPTDSTSREIQTSMAGSRQALNAQPNLTPILDMVFQLITFFMLVINFKAASLDMSVQLPVIGSALPTESGERDVLVLNVMPNGKLRMYGEERDVETLHRARGAGARQSAGGGSSKAGTGSELPTAVIIRADRTTPYHYIHQVIQACQAHGFRNFQYRALSTGT